MAVCAERLRKRVQVFAEAGRVIEFVMPAIPKGYLGLQQQRLNRATNMIVDAVFVGIIWI